MNPSNPNPLWTKDFTIITVGSFVSMLGNSLSGFAMSLLVLDYTKSAMLYALYMFLYTLPQVAVPLFSGPFVDNFSRKRVVYSLDFLSAGIFLTMGIIMLYGWFNFPIMAVLTFFVGAINSIYLVAFNSLFPMLITKGNYDKAYSISGILETLSVVGIPLSALVYNLVGIAPLFLFNAVSFFLAAVMETRISVVESYVHKSRAERKRVSQQLWQDFGYGCKYLVFDRGLFAIVGFFFFFQMAAGAAQVITLPYFKGHFPDGEFYYMLVWGVGMLGRVVGGGLYYRLQIPVKAKYALAMVAMIGGAVLEGVYLYLPVAIMVFMTFTVGACNITALNIRLAGTQGYVPEDKKGRFNGLYATLTTGGLLLGQLLAGFANSYINSRLVLAFFMGLCALSAIVCIGRNKRWVAPIYNSQA